MMLRTALVADDNELNRKILVRMLAKKNIKAEIAINGPEAIEKVKSQITSTKKNFDFIFMDYELGDGKGDKVTAAIRNIERDEKVEPSIIFTWSLAYEGCYPGSNQAVKKPITQKEIERIFSDENLAELKQKTNISADIPAEGKKPDDKKEIEEAEKKTIHKESNKLFSHSEHETKETVENKKIEGNSSSTLKHN